MKTTVLIGIDMGSSSLKALALDATSGQSLAVAREALPHTRLPGGGCEVGQHAIREALNSVLAGVARQLGPRTADVSAMACTGHGAGLYALDARGQLVGQRAVSSGDQRASARALALSQRQGVQLFEAVGCSPWPGQPTVIAAELLGPQAVHSGLVQHLLFAKDYLGFLLTGEIATDASDASTAGLVSQATGTWSQLAFDACGIQGLGPRVFGPMLQSGAVLGTLLPAEAARCGLPAGIPVAMGAIDLLASMDAVDARARGRTVSVLGTWCVNAVFGPLITPQPAVAAIVNLGQDNERLYMENSPSSMANIAWLASVLALPDTRVVTDLAMSVPLGASGLRFLPFVNGGAGRTAGFVGLKSHHSRADMARAVVDAVAALHVQHIRRLAACGLAASRSTLLGGGASDTRLVRLLASLLGRPVERCAEDETGARGAALYAAMALGYGRAAQDSPLMAPLDSVEPDPENSQAYADFNADFDLLVGSMPPASTLSVSPAA